MVTLVAFGAGTLAYAQVSKPAPPASKPPARAPAKPADAGLTTLQKKAHAAREAGDFETAVALYRKALAAQPRWKDGLWSLGTTLYELERWKEARDAFGRLLRIEPKHGAAFAFQGLSAFHLEDYETALEDLMQSKALGVSGNRELGSVARFHAGITMTRLGHFEMALHTLGEFALEGNDSPQIIEGMGLPTLRMALLPSELPADRREIVLMAGRASYHMAARLLPAAKAAFEELAIRYPETPEVHYAFGSFLLAEESDRALAEFKRELAIQPNHVFAMLQMAFEYLKRGDPASARPLAMRAVELAPNAFVAHKALGQAQLDANEIDAAITSLETARSLAEDSPSVRFTLAKAYQRAGRTTEAEKERAEFTRLDRLVRTQRSGVQAVGGVAAETVK